MRVQFYESVEIGLEDALEMVNVLIYDGSGGVPKSARVTPPGLYPMVGRNWPRGPRQMDRMDQQDHLVYGHTFA